jgi:RNase P subunit RPR2
MSNVKRRICHNCKKTNRGQLVPNPNSKNKEELIWICDNCYEDPLELRTAVQNG